PVGPVDDAVVDATLPYLNRFVAGMVNFQRLTGCRSGEVCIIRRCDIDTGGVVWLYKPPHHKTAWRGKTGSIAVGPKAQELLKEFFTAHLSEYLFSPKRAVEEQLAERSANRKTPKCLSHMARNAKKRTKNPERTPKENHDHNSYARAVARACDEAFPPPAPLAKQEKEIIAGWKPRRPAVRPPFNRKVRIPRRHEGRGGALSLLRLHRHDYERRPDRVAACPAAPAAGWVRTTLANPAATHRTRFRTAD